MSLERWPGERGGKGRAQQGEEVDLGHEIEFPGEKILQRTVRVEGPCWEVFSGNGNKLEDV